MNATLIVYDLHSFIGIRSLKVRSITLLGGPRSVCRPASVGACHVPAADPDHSWLQAATVTNNRYKSPTRREGYQLTHITSYFTPAPDIFPKKPQDLCPSFHPFPLQRLQEPSQIAIPQYRSQRSFLLVLHP